MDSVIGIKRLNPETNLPFKRGDRDERGFYFVKYKGNNLIKKNGFIQECWVKNLDLYLKNAANLKKQKYEDLKKKIKNGNIIINKRLNPKTNDFYKKGEEDRYGNIFIQYQFGHITKDNFYDELWKTKKQYFDYMILSTLNRIKRRSKHKNIKFDLDFEYLKNIFPQNFLCPVLKIKMEFADKSNRLNPSLDRINPKLGYVKGNVAFISFRANSIKNNATFEEILAVGNWLKEMEKQNE